VDGALSDDQDQGGDGSARAATRYYICLSPPVRYSQFVSRSENYQSATRVGNDSLADSFSVAGIGGEAIVVNTEKLNLAYGDS